MPKTDSLMGKLIFMMLAIIIALIGMVFTFQQSGMAENKSAIATLGNKVAIMNELFIGAGYEKEKVRKNIFRIEKRLEKIEGRMP